MRRLLQVLTLLLAGIGVANAQTQLDPATQINWPKLTGSGAPSGNCPVAQTGVLTSGSVSVPVVNVTGILPNQIVAGSGIAAGTTVASVNASTLIVTLSQNATASSTTSLSFYNYGRQYTDTTGNVQYVCGSSGWFVVNILLTPPVTIPDGGTGATTAQGAATNIVNGSVIAPASAQIGQAVFMQPSGPSIQTNLNAGLTSLLLGPGTYGAITSIPSGAALKCQIWMQCTVQLPAGLTVGVNGGGVPGAVFAITAYSYSSPYLTLTMNNTLALGDDIRFPVNSGALAALNGLDFDVLNPTSTTVQITTSAVAGVGSTTATTNKIEPFTFSMEGIVLDFSHTGSGLVLNDTLNGHLDLTVQNATGAGVTFLGTCLPTPGSCTNPTNHYNTNAGNYIDHLICLYDGSCVTQNGDQNITACGASQTYGGASWRNHFGTIEDFYTTGNGSTYQMNLTSGVDSNDYKNVFIDLGGGPSNGWIFGSRCPTSYGDIDGNYIASSTVTNIGSGNAVVANFSNGIIDFLWTPGGATSANQWVSNGYDDWDKHILYDLSNSSIASQHLAQSIWEKTAGGVSTQYSAHVQAGTGFDDMLFSFARGAGGSTNHTIILDPSITAFQVGTAAGSGQYAKSGMTVFGTPPTGGTGTTNVPEFYFDGNPTSEPTNWGNGSYFGINMPPVSSATCPNAFDVHYSGASVFHVGCTGILAAASSLEAGGINNYFGTSTPLNAVVGIAVDSGTNVISSDLGRTLLIAPGSMTRTADTGTYNRSTSNSIGVPTFLCDTACTYTNGDNLFIAGDPIAGSDVTITNPWALEVLGHVYLQNLRLGGNVVVPSGSYYQETLTTPASSSAACTTGQFTDDANYHYVCVAPNTWKRSALTTF